MTEDNSPPTPMIPAENKATRRKLKQILGFDLINENILLPGSNARRVIDDTMRGSGKWIRSEACECREPRKGNQRCSGCCVNFKSDFECTSALCAAALNACWNRALTDKRHKDMQVIARPEIGGMGLITLQFIKNWDLIVEYCGVVSTEEENPHGQLGHLSSYACSLIDAPFQHQAVIVDATEFGNIARYINHSHNPNCKVGKMRVGNDIRVVIRANRDIQPGEELLWNYGATYKLVGIEICGCQAGVKKCDDHEEFKATMEERKKKQGPQPPLKLLPISPATSCSSGGADHPDRTTVEVPETKPKKKLTKKKSSSVSVASSRVTRSRRGVNQEMLENEDPQALPACLETETISSSRATPVAVLRSPVIRTTPCRSPTSPTPPALTPHTPTTSRPATFNGCPSPVPPILSPMIPLRTPAFSRLQPCNGSPTPSPPPFTPLTPRNPAAFRPPVCNGTPTPSPPPFSPLTPRNPASSRPPVCNGTPTPSPPPFSPLTPQRAPASSRRPPWNASPTLSPNNGSASASPQAPAYSPLTPANGNRSLCPAVGSPMVSARTAASNPPMPMTPCRPQNAIQGISTPCNPQPTPSCSNGAGAQAAGGGKGRRIVVPRASTRKVQSSDEELVPEPERMITRLRARNMREGEWDAEQERRYAAAEAVRMAATKRRGKKKIVRPTTAPSSVLQPDTQQESGQRQYTCGDCGVVFHDRYLLTNHMYMYHWSLRAPPLESLFPPRDNHPGFSGRFNQHQSSTQGKENAPPPEVPLHENPSMETLSSEESDMSM